MKKFVALAPLLALFTASCAAQTQAPPAPVAVPIAATVVGARPGVRLPVSFNAPDQGFASLALYDKNGVLVRSLLYGQPVTKGVNTLNWDATSDLGVPVAPGTYSAKGIFFKTKPSADWVMKVGKSGEPPYRTPDGKGDWGGNLGYPSALAANSNSVVMIYAAVEDAQTTGIQQMDAQGHILMRYFSFYAWDTRMAAAMDETNLYLGIGSQQKKQLEIAEYKLGQPRGKILAQLPTKAHEDTGETRWRGRWDAFLSGLAIGKDTIFASVAADDALFVVDRASGKIRRQIQVPAPSGLAIWNDKLLVVSGTKILRLSLEGEVEATVIAEGLLQAPNSLAIDKSGNLYVGDGGVLKMMGPQSGGAKQIWVFAPDGKLLRKIGAPAPDEGQFKPDTLGKITSLALGPNGKLWVNDIATGFPRTSRWTPDGALEKQWFARKLSLYADAHNPARPDEMISIAGAFSDEPGISAWQIDLDKKSWIPSWHYDTTWDEMYQEDVFLSFKHNGNPLKDKRWPVFDYSPDTFVTHAGRNYFMNRSGNGEGAIFVYDGKSQPKPVGLVGFHRARRADGKIEDFYDRGPNNWFTWADTNGDGQMAMDEITLTENPESLKTTNMIYEARLDKNLDIHLKRLVVENGQTRFVDGLLPLKKLLPDGAPVYDWADLREPTKLQIPDFNGGDGTKKVAQVEIPIPLETKDAFYALVKPSPEGKLRLAGIDGEGWWASRNWRKKLVKWDKNGDLEWAVGRRAPGLAQPGQMYHPVHLSGIAGGALFVADTLGKAWVWNSDGLFLGGLLNGPGDGDKGPPSDSIYGETQSMDVWTARDGKIYLAFSDTGNSIFEVHLPVTQPISGKVLEVTAAQSGTAQAWDPDGVAPTDSPRAVAAFTSKAPVIDGKLEGVWYRSDSGNRPEILVLLDGERLAGVRALYDQTNLYLAYDVRAQNGAQNAGSELPDAPFTSGAYVDFSLAPTWNGPRSEVKAGDLRVVLAQVKAAAGNADFQQGFWQKKPNGAHPQTITSPAASITFDDISEVPGLKMATKIGDQDARTGLVPYSVEVSIPLSSLGLTNPAGKTVGFDASVAVANAAGDRRERAAHWAGLSEGTVVDRPGSTQLLPQTWGELFFAPAP